MKDYFRKRGDIVELQRSQISAARLRSILLNLIYVEKMGTSPFDVKYKGNDPHVDHIYPKSMLRSKLACSALTSITSAISGSSEPPITSKTRRITC